MNKIALLFFLSIMAATANAAQIESGTAIAFVSNGTSKDLAKMSSAGSLSVDSAFVQSPQFGRDNEFASSVTWSVGLGLFLVFLGYRMKSKAE